MNELSDSVAWPSRDPEWVTKVLLIGLISLVPIAGWLNLFGWMLAALDNLRAGRRQLPPATFDYIRRGGNLFVVYFVYGLVLAVAFGILFGVGIVIVAGTDGEANAVGIPLILLAYALLLLGVLGWYLVTPAVILATERGGIGGGLNVARVMAIVGADVDGALQHGLFALVASLIGGLGVIVCFIGEVFTAPYGYAVLAGVVHHYERTAGPSAATAG